MTDLRPDLPPKSPPPDKPTDSTPDPESYVKYRDFTLWKSFINGDQATQRLRIKALAETVDLVVAYIAAIKKGKSTNG